MKEYLTRKAYAKLAFRRARNLSIKGWIGVIVLTVFLVFMMTWGVQLATGIEVYTILNNPTMVGGQGDAKPGKVLLARVLLGAIAFSAVVYLYTMWNRQGGAAGFLVGGRAGRSDAFQLDRKAMRDVEAEARVANVLENNARKAMQEAVTAKSTALLAEAREASRIAESTNSIASDIERAVSDVKGLSVPATGTPTAPTAPTAGGAPNPTALTPGSVTAPSTLPLTLRSE